MKALILIVKDEDGNLGPTGCCYHCMPDRDYLTSIFRDDLVPDEKSRLASRLVGDLVDPEIRKLGLLYLLISAGQEQCSLSSGEEKRKAQTTRTENSLICIIAPYNYPLRVFQIPCSIPLNQATVKLLLRLTQ